MATKQAIGLTIVALMMVCAGHAAQGDPDEHKTVDSCNRVLDTAEEEKRLHGESAAARDTHSSIVSGGFSLTAECRLMLSERLGESCERLDGLELYACAELLEEAVSAADVPLGDRWQIQVDVFSRAFEQRRKDGNLAAAERTLEDLHRVIARSPESVRSGLLRDLLLEQGSFYFEAGRLKEAESSYSELLTMSRRSDDPDVSDLVFPLQRLAAVYEAQGRLDDSRAYLEKAISVVEAEMGRDSPALILPLEQYSRVLNALGERELAARSRDRADRLR